LKDLLKGDKRKPKYKFNQSMNQEKISNLSEEHKRLSENATLEVPIERWGSYLSERQWSTVREDYSSNGDPWAFFPHDHARSKAYRWGEDGLGGICDRSQYICFAFAFWNGKIRYSKNGYSD
jgi:hypothetical protein